MSQTVKGNGGPVPQPVTFEWVAGQGWTTVFRWRGTKAAIMGLANLLQKSFEFGDITTQDGVIWEMTGRIARRIDGSAEVPINTWELDQQPATRDLRLHAASQALGDAVLRDINAKLADPTADVTIPTGDATRLYQLLLRGQDSYFYSSWVLRHTQSASRSYKATLATGGVNKLWTFAQIDALAPESYIRTAIANLAAAPETVPTDYSWSWLKQAVSLSKAFQQRTVITQTWILEMWPTFTYDNY